MVVYAFRSLTGHSVSVHNLPGRSVSSRILTPSTISFMQNDVGGEPLEIEEFKAQVFNKIVIPFSESNDEFLEEDLFNIQLAKEKLKELKEKYSDFDLSYYENLMNLISIACECYEMNKKYESYVPKKDVINFSLQVKKILLKAEYEVYSLLYGKPDIKCGETYSEKHIEAIRKIIYDGNLKSLDSIQETLLKLGLYPEELHMS